MGVIGVKPFNVTAKDEDSHTEVLSAADRAEHFQDHIGIGVFGRCGDLDILVTSTIYHVGGRVWSVQDAALLQTNFLVNDSSNRTMTDNAFVGNRLDPVSAFTNFEIKSEGDSVIWCAGNRQTICKPPFWEIKGEHLGVDIDIRLRGIGKALPYRGAWDQLSTSGIAGNELLAKAEGQVSYQGKTYVLDEAWAVRERMCLGVNKDVISLLSHTPGYLWGWVFSENFKMFCHAVGDTGTYAARVYLGDAIEEFGPDEVVIKPLKYWNDPISNVSYPVRWHIEINSSRGELVMEAGIWSRCLFGFYQLKGFSLHMGALGRASGKFRGQDGKLLLLNDITAYFDQGKATLLPAA